MAPMRTRAMAESLMFTTSVPASRSSRAASSVRSIRMLRGGSISTEITKRRSVRARARRVAGGRSSASASGASASAKAARGLAPATGLGRSRAPARACERRRSAVVMAPRACAMAATWAGVVPQQPPITDAPASSRRGTMDPK